MSQLLRTSSGEFYDILTPSGTWYVNIFPWTILKIARGEWRSLSWVVYVLTALFIVRFLYLSA